jgi:hypothetical protein
MNRLEVNGLGLIDVMSQNLPGGILLISGLRYEPRNSGIPVRSVAAIPAGSTKSEMRVERERM